MQKQNPELQLLEWFNYEERVEEKKSIPLDTLLLVELKSGHYTKEAPMKRFQTGYFTKALGSDEVVYTQGKGLFVVKPNIIRYSLLGQLIADINEVP